MKVKFEITKFFSFKFYNTQEPALNDKNQYILLDNNSIITLFAMTDPFRKILL